MSKKKAEKGLEPTGHDETANELLAHYKCRIEEFERERQLLLSGIDRCSAQQEEIHRLEWENRKRTEEIRELQKALSDAHNFLFEERQRLLALQAENDELRLQEMGDRSKIKQLLAMTQPLEQEVIYSRDALPSAVTLYPNRRGPGGGGAAAGSSRPGSGPAPAQQQQPGNSSGGGGERVLRTVFLPTQNADLLMLKIESLQAQLNEQRQLSKEHIDALLEDRRVKEQEYERHHANHDVQVEQLTQKLKRTEELLRHATRDYILVRRQMQEAAARAADSETRAAEQQQRARQEYVALQTQTEQAMSQLQQESGVKMKQYLDKLREQVRAREDELMSLASVHTATKAQLEGRVGELDGKVARLTEQNKQLEVRRHMDLEGFTQDVSMLRKQLAVVDRKLLQMRLVERLEDDDRLDTLLDQWNEGAPAVAAPSTAAARRPGTAVGSDASPGGGARSVKSELAADLRDLRSNIARLDARLAERKKKASVRVKT